jgi:hypothetical protein
VSRIHLHIPVIHLLSLHHHKGSRQKLRVPIRFLSTYRTRSSHCAQAATSRCRLLSLLLP